MHETYNEGFYAWQREGSYRSAQRVVPALLGLFPIRSVLDVGCGVGTWLRAFQEAGVADLAGVDGPWIAGQAHAVAPGIIQPRDLNARLDLGRRFDLVTSFEVAEHLEPGQAGPFIDNLVRHGDRVAFSAAAPHQGGNGHLNEQWPEYWAELFRARGFHCFDPLRARIWTDGEVEWWYAQNLFLAVRAGLPAPAGLEPVQPLLPLVHPGRYTFLASRVAELQNFLGLGDWETPGLSPWPVVAAAARLMALQVDDCIVCGSGAAGLTLARVLRRCAIQVRAFSDRDPAKTGTTLDGIPVLGLEGALALGTRVAVAASLTRGGEIAEELRAACARLGQACPEIIQLDKEQTRA